MFNKKIKIRKWLAKTTNRGQGTASKSIKLGNKSIAKLSFRVKSDSPYWRAGFKLCSPNGSDLPLRSQDSLLFHVGAKEHNDTISVTIYINGERRKDEALRHAKNDEIIISFEVNENNFITCLINDVQVFHERVDSAISKKAYLLAWGDSLEGKFRQYEVKFKNVIGFYRAENKRAKNAPRTKSIFKKWEFWTITLMVVGILIAVLAWQFPKNSSQQQDSPDLESATSTKSTSNPKSLYEYFTTDFPKYLSMNQSMGTTVFASTSATNKKEDYKLEFRLHCDFDSLTKFISVYLPSSTYPNVKTISEEIAVKAPDIADAISSSSGMIVNGSRYGDRGSEIKDLKFSGRIYIYHQAYLSGDEIDELRRFYKGKSLDPIFRDSNYQTTRWLWDKDKSD